MHICCVFCWQLLLNIVFLFLVIVKLPFLLTSGIMPLCMQFISRSTRMEKICLWFLNEPGFILLSYGILIFC